MKTYVWMLLAGMLCAPMAGQSQNPPAPAAGGTPGGGHGQPAAVAPELADAEDKIEHQNFDGAKPVVERYLSQHANDARALFDLGYLEQATNHDDAAAEDFRRAIASDPKQFESRLALGLLLARQGKPDEARAQLEEATHLSPSAPNPAAQAQAFRTLALLDRTSDPNAAKSALLSALRLSPETPQDLLLTAQIAESTGDLETAETAYRRLLDAHSGADASVVSEATGGLVQTMLKQRNYSDAEPLLRSALGHDPDNPSLNAQLATTLIGEGKNEEVLPILEKLRQLEPNNASVDEMLADAYSQAGHPEKADPVYAAMAKAHPQDAEILAGQGNNLIREEHYVEAQQVLEQAVKLKPDNGNAWSGLAFASSQNKQYSITLQALSMRAKYLPETPASYFLWATSYDNLHQSKVAAEYYRKFLDTAAGKFPDQEWQAKHRLVALGRSQ